MNIARLFAYTRLLEKQYAELKEQYKAAQEKWEQREAALLDRILYKAGLPSVQPPKSTDDGQQSLPYKTPRQRELDRLVQEQRKLEMLYKMPTKEAIQAAVAQVGQHNEN